MAKAELGDKQVCPSCGAKFYDLRKRPATCPKCSFSFDPTDETVKLRRAKSVRTPNYERDDEEEEERVEAEVEEGFEEEVEETPELDAEAADEPILASDDDEESEGASPDALPAGFSEEEVELEDETPVDDEAPMLDLEEDEDFAEEELGEIAEGDDEDEDGRR